MKYQALLFDFDGTLVDSMPTYQRVMLQILDENGIRYTDEIMKIITPLGYVGTARYYVQRLGVNQPEEALVARMNVLALDSYAHTISAKAGVVETLRLLKTQGYSLNVLTASPHAALDPCLERLGIMGLMDHVWSCEDFSTTKSDPMIYHQAAERLGLSLDQVLFLDDNLNADRCAKEAGMAVCGVYDPTSAAYREDIRAVADYYIQSFRELPGILQG